jgi:hypothetical protein
MLQTSVYILGPSLYLVQLYHIRAPDRSLAFDSLTVSSAASGMVLVGLGRTRGQNIAERND